MTMLEESDEGSQWLYWDPKPRRWHRVELLTVPSPNAKRVRVQHIDRDMGGSAEWVPAARCKARWSDRDEYLSRAERWRLIEKLAPPTHVSDIAQAVIDMYVDDSVAEIRGAGVMVVRDLNRLEDSCGISPEIMVSGGTAFEEKGAWMIPWASAEQVVVGMCSRDPAPALRLLDDEVRRHHSFDRLVDEDGPRWWQRIDELSEEDKRFAHRTRIGHEGRLAATQQLRDWLDPAEAPGLAQAYIELRGMYSDVIAAANEARPRLLMDRTFISKRIADRLKELTSRPTPVVDIRGLRSGDEW
ncbi:hypothetical protein Q9S78_12145 [Microbacterium sp. KSW-18]|uniref:Uncharacterized protein n=1 Tax=Microbacterium aquilitoris TaxID=3067307 RepID=A0ABU3GL41_9MICO|nr:hypothetical protein [Microbacterium sp. KSW-18]MDT3331418.1 hypothetical protein [Microbacterium sp. KSW-18]